MSYTRIALATSLVAGDGLGLLHINDTNDILFAILSFFCAKDAGNLSLVCKQWNKLFKKQGYLWNSFINQERNSRSLVIERPVGVSSHLFYKLNRQALNATREKLRNSIVNDGHYFLNVLREDNFIIAYHKKLISDSIMECLRENLCCSDEAYALLWHDYLLLAFRSFARNLLEEGIDGGDLFKILIAFIYEQKEPIRLEYLFRQYDLAKLIGTNTYTNVPLYGAIPLSSLEKVNHENFTVLLDMIRNGTDKATAIKDLYSIEQHIPEQNKQFCILSSH